MKSLKEQIIGEQLSYQRGQIGNGVNKSLYLRKIDDKELVALKRCVMFMFKHLKNICETNGLILMLTGGSCLGAVRHKGFIPWDDDLDLMMPRKDFDKLLKICEKGLLGKEYEFTYPRKGHDAPCAFLKIYLRDTKIVRIGGLRNKYPNGVFIDIFPIEGAPKNVFFRYLKGLVANFLRLCSNMVDAYEEKSIISSEYYKGNKMLYFNIRSRQILGRMLSTISHTKWICWYDRFIKDAVIKEFAGIPTGRKLYVGEILPSNCFLPPSKGIFEGIEVNLPANPDAYLKNLYGDYMEIPSVEKRESHMISELQIPVEFYKS